MSFWKLLGMTALVVFIIILIPVIIAFLSIAGPVVIAIFVLIFPLLAVGALIGYYIGKKK